MERSLIAPCGINCAVCRQYQKKKDGCKGCRFETNLKSRTCTLKNCAKPSKTNPELCAGCTALPCRRLRDFDRRYWEKTCGFLSVIDNLRKIEQQGMDAFLKQEKAKWTYSSCGSRLSVSFYTCPFCGSPYRKASQKELEREERMKQKKQMRNQ